MYRLGVSTRVENRSVIVSVEGDLDIATAGDLRSAVQSAVDAHGPWLILDFSARDVMDSSGLNAIIHAYHLLRHRGCSRPLGAPNERVARAIRRVGRHRQLPGPRTLAEAVAAMRALVVKQAG